MVYKCRSQSFVDGYMLLISIMEGGCWCGQGNYECLWKF